MRQVMHRAFGGPEVLELVDAPEPHAAAGQVRVRLHAASLNPVDWKIVAGGAAASGRGLQPPLGVGNDIAGIVDEVGDGVRDFAVGDRVFGSARARALQDATVVTLADERLAHVPGGVDLATASCLVVAGRTAWDAVETLDLQRGQTLLVHGASGGVGDIAVQLAVLRGLRVVGTASEANLQRIVDVGGEGVVYGEGLVERLRAKAPLDGMLDAAGHGGTDAGLSAGVPSDRMITIADKSAGAPGVRTDLGRTGALDELAALVASGDLRVQIAERWPLEQAADAYRSLIDGHHVGKIVIEF